MMRLSTNRRIKFLLAGILWPTLAFTSISAPLVGSEVRSALYCIPLSSLCMGAVILMFYSQYFREQRIIMENAISQIKESISGNKDVTIERNDKGELYRLFHEINSLVPILNAHTVNETNPEKSLQNIISDISHQLETSFAALNTCNGIIQDEGKNSPVIQEFSLLSKQKLDRIEALVQNLLKTIKPGVGMTILEKSLEHVSELTKNIKQHFLFRAQGEGKEVCLSGSGKITPLCDRTWTIEAISNLAKGAPNRTEKGSFVCVEWQAPASVIQITIEDNGCGIHPEDLHYALKQFYRSRFPKGTQGVSLGLPLARAIVGAYNSTTEADNTLGIGTSVTINFLIPSRF